MDESWAMARDGLDAVKLVCHNKIVAISDSRPDDDDTSLVLPISDVELSCIRTAGPSEDDEVVNELPTKHTALDPLNILSAAKTLKETFKIGGAGDSGKGSAGAPEAGSIARSSSSAGSLHGLQAYEAIRITSAHLAPITEIVVLHGDDPVPPNFTKLTQSISKAYSADLNTSGGSRQLWLAVARIPNATPVCGLCFIDLELGEFIPPTFTPIKRAANGRVANLRVGNPSSELLLCVSKAPGAPLLDIGLAFPNGAMSVPKLPGSSRGDKGAAASPGARPAESVGTVAQLESQARAKGPGFLGLGAEVKQLVNSTVSMFNPGKEEVPLGYTALTRTVLGGSAMLTGGTARGPAVLVMARDTTHIDLLADASSLLPIARQLVRSVEREYAEKGRSIRTGDARDEGEAAGPQTEAGAGANGSTGVTVDEIGHEAIRRAADIVGRGCGSGAAIPLDLAVARATARGSVHEALTSAASGRAGHGRGSDKTDEVPASPAPSVPGQPGSATGSSGLLNLKSTVNMIGQLFRGRAGGQSMANVLAGQGGNSLAAVSEEESPRPEGGSAASGPKDATSGSGGGGLFSPRRPGDLSNSLKLVREPSLNGNAASMAGLTGITTQGGTEDGEGSSARGPSLPTVPARLHLGLGGEVGTEGHAELVDGEGEDEPVEDRDGPAAAGSSSNGPRSGRGVLRRVSSDGAGGSVASAAAGAARSVGSVLASTSRRVSMGSVRQSSSHPDLAGSAAAGSSGSVNGLRRGRAGTSHSASGQDRAGTPDLLMDTTPDPSVAGSVSGSNNGARRPRIATDSGSSALGIGIDVSADGGDKAGGNKGYRASAGSHSSIPGLPASEGAPGSSHRLGAGVHEDEEPHDVMGLGAAGPHTQEHLHRMREAASASLSGQDGEDAAGVHGAEDAAAVRIKTQLLKYRHMGWIHGNGALRMTLAEANNAAAAAAGQTGTVEGPDGALSPSGSSDPDGLGLMGFLAPSLASLTVAPLLKGLYSTVPEVMCASLRALARVAGTGWFMAPPEGSHRAAGASKTGSTSTDPEDSEAESSLRVACALDLLDVAVACAVDAASGHTNEVATALLEFLRAAYNVLAACPPSEHPLRLAGWRQQPWGMHPATLHKTISAGLAIHAFFQQKRIYSERGAIISNRAGAFADEAGFKARAATARAEAGHAFTILRELVAGVAASLERDGAASDIEPLAREAAGVAGSTAANVSSGPPLLGRTRFGDYTDVARTYSAHGNVTSTLAAELHAACSRFVLRRPFPLPSAPAPGPHGLDGAQAAAASRAIAGVARDVDAFGPAKRSPAVDVVLLLAILSKQSMEPLANSGDASSLPGVMPLGLGPVLPDKGGAGASGSGGGSVPGQPREQYKRLSNILLKETCLLLLQDFFSATGPVFANTPLAVSCVGRILVPSLLSHAFTPRLLSDHLWICAAAAGSGASGAGEPSSSRAGNGTIMWGESNDIVAGGGGAKPGFDRDGLPTTISVYRAVLAVVGSMWASKGADEDVTGKALGSAIGQGLRAGNGVTDATGEPMCLSVREACAREIVALARALLLPPLQVRCCPPGLRLDALEELSSWVAVPQLLMELFINADAHPGAACPYPHARFLRPLAASLVSTAVSRRAASSGPFLHPSVLASARTGLAIPGLALGGLPGLEGGLVGMGGMPGSSPFTAVGQLLLGGDGSEPPPHPDNLPPSAGPLERAVAWDAWGRDEARKNAAAVLASLFRGLMDSAATVHMVAGEEEEDARAAWDPASPAHPSVAARRPNKSSVVAHGQGGSLTLVPPTPAKGFAFGLGGGAKGGSSSSSSSSSSNAMTTPVKDKGGHAGAGQGASTTPRRVTSSYDLPGAPVVASVRALHAAQDKSESSYYSNLLIAHDKGCRKGMLSLMDSGYVHRSGGGVAHFLRLCGHETGPDAEVGDFLGEEGRTAEEQSLMKSVRACYLGSMSFAGMPFDLALRHMLTRGGFRLPGEAQKIDRLTSAFAAAYYQDNRPSHALVAAQSAGTGPGAKDGQAGAAAGGDTANTAATGSGTTSSKAKPPGLRSIATADGRLYPAAPDVVEILAFSTIMLNTDAHNPSIKKERKMTVKQFISNNREIDGGNDLPTAFLEHLYWAIVSNEIKMNNTPTAAHAAGDAAKGGAGAGAGAAASTPAEASGTATVESVARLAGAPLSVLPGSVPGVASCSAAGLAVLEPETDSPSDAAVFLKALGLAAARWANLTAGAVKADDARGAVASVVHGSGLATPGSGFGSGGGPNSVGSSSASTISSSAMHAGPADFTSPGGGEDGANGSAALPPGPSPVWYPVPYKRTFSVTTVTCALLDLWPHALSLAHYTLKLQAAQGGGPLRLTSGGLLPDVVPAAKLDRAPAQELELRLSALDCLKAGISAALFLGPGPAADVIATGAAALIAVESALLGPDKARASRTGPEGWCKAVMAMASTTASTTAPDPVACAEAVGLLHMAVAELRDAASNQAEAATLASTAARFKGDLGKLLEGGSVPGGLGAGGAGGRRLLYEGDLTKVASGGRGKHSTYRFWLFTDLLVYGSKGGIGGLFSDKYQARQAIPLASVRLQPDPPELLGQGVAPGVGWRLDTAVKPLFLVATNEADATAWKRHLREALTELSRVAEEEEEANAARRVTATAVAAGFQDSRAGDATATKSAAGATGRRGSTARMDSTSGSQATPAAGAQSGKTLAGHPSTAGPLSGSGEDVRSIGSGTTDSHGTIGRAAAAGRAFLAEAHAVIAAGDGSTPAPAGAASAVAPPPLPATVHGSGAAVVRAPFPAESHGPATPSSSAHADAIGITASAVGVHSVVSARRAARAITGSDPAPASPALSTVSTASGVSGVARGPYDNLSDLKQAFLRAVAFCRPLLSADGVTEHVGSGSGPVEQAAPANTEAPASPTVRGTRVSAGSRSPSAALCLSDVTKLSFYGLFKQATAGDCPVPVHEGDISMMLTPGDSEAAHVLRDPAFVQVARAKRDAWRQCGGMRRRDAMRAFCELLDGQVQGWDRSQGQAEGQA